MMIRSIVGLLLGGALGMVLAGSLGGALGAVCGAGLGMLWGSVRPSHTGVKDGTAVTREEREVVCISRGEVADCVMLRDQETGDLVDVESCSLEPEGVHPRCFKRCLDLLPRRRARRVKVQEPAEVTP